MKSAEKCNIFLWRELFFTEATWGYDTLPTYIAICLVFFIQSCHGTARTKIVNILYIKPFYKTLFVSTVDCCKIHTLRLF
jgi:hypothetical protein